MTMHPAPRITQKG